jgi:hypothetical protein
MKPLMLFVVAMLQSVPALAREIIDEKTHEYTPYGYAITVVAAAQVREMRCDKKGLIDLAIAKALRSGVSIDLNDKEDFSAVLFQVTEILTGHLKDDGVIIWCKNSAVLDQFLKEP